MYCLKDRDTNINRALFVITLLLSAFEGVSSIIVLFSLYCFVCKDLYDSRIINLLWSWWSLKRQWTWIIILTMLVDYFYCLCTIAVFFVSNSCWCLVVLMLKIMNQFFYLWVLLVFVFGVCSPTVFVSSFRNLNCVK